MSSFRASGHMLHVGSPLCWCAVGVVIISHRIFAVGTISLYQYSVMIIVFVCAVVLQIPLAEVADLLDTLQCVVTQPIDRSLYLVCLWVIVIAESIHVPILCIVRVVCIHILMWGCPSPWIYICPLLKFAAIHLPPPREQNPEIYPRLMTVQQ